MKTKMTPPTEQALKRMLAMMLPEKIYYDDEFGFFFWKPDEPVNQNPAEPSKFEVDWLNGVCVDIRDTEWPYIGGLVEEKMTAEEVEKYEDACEESIGEGSILKGGFDFAFIHMSWAQRAQAMFEIGFLKGG